MSLRELAQHFDMESDAIEPMLTVLVEKGQVHSEMIGCAGKCSGCVSANREDMLIYELKE